MIFPSASATKIEQLVDDIIAYYYICCSPLSFCTPVSKWEEAALCEAPVLFLFGFACFSFAKKNPKNPPGQFDQMSLPFKL